MSDGGGAEGVGRVRLVGSECVAQPDVGGGVAERVEGEGGGGGLRRARERQEPLEHLRL